MPPLCALFARTIWSHCRQDRFRASVSMRSAPRASALCCLARRPRRRDRPGDQDAVPLVLLQGNHGFILSLRGRLTVQEISLSPEGAPCLRRLLCAGCPRGRAGGRAGGGPDAKRPRECELPGPSVMGRISGAAAGYLIWMGKPSTMPPASDSTLTVVSPPGEREFCCLKSHRPVASTATVPITGPPTDGPR
jgi:hypothetical protein